MFNNVKLFNFLKKNILKKDFNKFNFVLKIIKIRLYLSKTYPAGDSNPAMLLPLATLGLFFCIQTAAVW